MKPLLCSASVVRNFLNSTVGAWPAKAIDPSKPFQWQDRRPLSKSDQPKTDVGEYAYRKMSGSEWLQKNSPLRGDVIYVRETLKVWRHPDQSNWAIYAADYPIISPVYEGQAVIEWRWKKNSVPSIHMPKELSRIHFEVMRVRVERASDISDADCLAEGMIEDSGTTPIGQFHMLWERLYGPDAWEKWCWVYDLKRIK